MTANYFLNAMQARTAQETCLTEAIVDGFSSPANALSSQMQAGGKLFIVGDSMLMQVCMLGVPGLCCSNSRPCGGPAPYSNATSPWQVQLEEMSPYRGQGWKYLVQLNARSRSNTAINTAYIIAPEVHDEMETVNRSVQLVAGFMHEKGVSEKDVLVLGMIGNHYLHGLEPFDKFTSGLLRSVVNPFPGRVVILGPSPQHFSAPGHSGQRCGPNPNPDEIDNPMNSFRSSIFLYNVWELLTNPRARLVDFDPILEPLWACHRDATDCTHWQDPIISIQAQLILNALEKIN